MSDRGDSFASRCSQGASGLRDDNAEGEEGCSLLVHIVEVSLDLDVERGGQGEWSWQGAGVFDAHCADRSSGFDPDSANAGRPRRVARGGHVQFDDIVGTYREEGTEGTRDSRRGAWVYDGRADRGVTTNGDIASGFELLVFLIEVETGIGRREKRCCGQGTAKGDGVCVGLKNLLGEAGSVFCGRFVGWQRVLSRSKSAVRTEDESPAGEDAEGSAYGHGRGSVGGCVSKGPAHDDGRGDFCVSREVRPADPGLGRGGGVVECGRVVVKNGEGNLLKAPRLLDLPRSRDAPGEGIIPP